MKVSIMQPYLFPYLGYFQLIHAVDIFVIYDDVQYIHHGWINRNKLLFDNKDHFFTFTVKKDSSKKLINQRFYSHELFETLKNNFLKRIKCTYKKAPYFSETYDLLSEILNYSNLNVAVFNSNSLKILCKSMRVETKFIMSSNLNKNNNLIGQERGFEILKLLGSQYEINAIGGLDLYSPDVYLQHGVTLKFIKMNDIKYPQFGNEFIPSLSIIDVLMFNSKDKIKGLLDEYELI